MFFGFTGAYSPFKLPALMGKRPTPKKRKAKSHGRTQHSIFLNEEIVRLRNLQNSPYAGPVPPKDKAGKALKNITRVKA